MFRGKRLVWAQVPDWTRPTNAVFRYVRQQQALNHGALWRWLRWTGSLAILAGLVAFSYAAAQNGTPLLMGAATKRFVFDLLYFPLVVVQGAWLGIALFATGGAITTEQQRGTWEAFKITTHGAELVIRARWAALFYQMRWTLGLLIGARLLLAGLMLIDLTQHEGDYLELYTWGITPEIPLAAAVLLLAAFMAAALLQVVVLGGLNGALGLLIAVAVRNRNARALAFGGAAVAELVLWSWSMGAANGPAAERWIRLLSRGVVGDQGLRLMDVQTHLNAWADIPYGALIGAGLVAALFAQVLVTHGILILAGRLAARPDRA